MNEGKKILCVSDRHYLDINAERSKADYLLELVKNNNYDKIILVGDTIDLAKTTVLSTKCIRFLDYVKNKLPVGTVVALEGNHEWPVDLAKEIYTKAGCTYTDMYRFKSGDKTFIAFHGHFFDPLCKDPANINNRLIIKFHHWFDLIFNTNIQRWIRSRSSWAAKRLDDIENDAIVEHSAAMAVKAASTRYDYVLMGHTHNEGITKHLRKDRESVMTYVNCGSWERETYVEILDGKVELKNFS